MNRTFRYRPVFYFSLTFALTYALWLVAAFLSQRDETRGIYVFFLLAGLLTPFIVSLVMIFTSGSPALKRDFLNRLINPALIRPAVLPALLLIMPCVLLVSTAISVLFGGSPEQFQLAEGFSFSVGFVPVLLVLLLAAAFEELGWRGYAFDSLQSRHNYLTAAIVFAVLWSLWHFPLIFVKDTYQYEVLHQSVWFGVNFFVSIIPLGVIVSWICIKNGKSVIAAILFHFIVNISQEILNVTQSTKCIETVVLALVAIAIVVMDRKLFFSRGRLPTEG